MVDFINKAKTSKHIDLKLQNDYIQDIDRKFIIKRNSSGNANSKLCTEDVKLIAERTCTGGVEKLIFDEQMKKNEFVMKRTLENFDLEEKAALLGLEKVNQSLSLIKLNLEKKKLKLNDLKGRSVPKQRKLSFAQFEDQQKGMKKFLKSKLRINGLKDLLNEIRELRELLEKAERKASSKYSKPTTKQSIDMDILKEEEHSLNRGSQSLQGYPSSLREANIVILHRLIYVKFQASKYKLEKKQDSDMLFEELFCSSTFEELSTYLKTRLPTILVYVDGLSEAARADQQQQKKELKKKKAQAFYTGSEIANEIEIEDSYSVLHGEIASQTEKQEDLLEEKVMIEKFLSKLRERRLQAKLTLAQQKNHFLQRLLNFSCSKNAKETENSSGDIGSVRQQVYISKPPSMEQNDIKVSKDKFREDMKEARKKIYEDLLISNLKYTEELSTMLNRYFVPLRTLNTAGCLIYFEFTEIIEGIIHSNKQMINTGKNASGKKPSAAKISGSLCRLLGDKELQSLYLRYKEVVPQMLGYFLYHARQEKNIYNFLVSLREIAPQSTEVETISEARNYSQKHAMIEPKILLREFIQLVKSPLKWITSIFKTLTALISLSNSEEPKSQQLENILERWKTDFEQEGLDYLFHNLEAQGEMLSCLYCLEPWKFLNKNKLNFLLNKTPKDHFFEKINFVDVAVTGILHRRREGRKADAQFHLKHATLIALSNCFIIAVLKSTQRRIFPGYQPNLVVHAILFLENFNFDWVTEDSRNVSMFCENKYENTLLISRKLLKETEELDFEKVYGFEVSQCILKFSTQDFASKVAAALNKMKESGYSNKISYGKAVPGSPRNSKISSETYTTRQEFVNFKTNKEEKTHLHTVTGSAISFSGLTMVEKREIALQKKLQRQQWTSEKERRSLEVLARERIKKRDGVLELEAIN
eukprot:snap_masked-scaffold_4-processed-gene-3.15-mRNA-1 protein AED:1.00 eAED:1.00 QI:0/-1/0/0/-1/1/1/0/928